MFYHISAVFFYNFLCQSKFVRFETVIFKHKVTKTFLLHNTKFFSVNPFLSLLPKICAVSTKNNFSILLFY
jgi:hypothetical protein